MPRLARIAAALVLVIAVVAAGSMTACSPKPKQSDTYTDPGLPLTSSDAETSTTPPTKLITADEVAKVSGIKGVTMVPKGQTDRATGNVNFANDKGGLFLVVVLGKAQDFDLAIGGDTWREDSKGVGDASYIGPSAQQSKTPNVFAFKKGNDAVALTSFFSGPDKTVLTMDQLKEIAKIIESRL